MDIRNAAIGLLAVAAFSRAFAQEQINVGSHMDGVPSAYIPVTVGQVVRVDYHFMGDSQPVIGSYNLRLVWNPSRVEFMGFEFGDGFGSEALGESTSSLTIIGENPFDSLHWAFWSQTSLLSESELRERQPPTFLGATGIFRVLDPAMPTIGYGCGIGGVLPETGYVAYLREPDGDPITFNCCSWCPLPLSPEFVAGSPLGQVLRVNVGDRVLYTVTATDGDNPLLSLNVTGTPSGASLTHYPLPRSNPISATLDWVADRRGVFHVQYVASDADPHTADPSGAVTLIVSRPTPLRSGSWLPGLTPLLRRSASLP